MKANIMLSFLIGFTAINARAYCFVSRAGQEICYFPSKVVCKSPDGNEKMNIDYDVQAQSVHYVKTIHVDPCKPMTRACGVVAPYDLEVNSDESPQQQSTVEQNHDHLLLQIGNSFQLDLGQSNDPFKYPINKLVLFGTDYSEQWSCGL